MTKKHLSLALAFATTLTALTAVSAFADTNTDQQNPPQHADFQGQGHMGHQGGEGQFPGGMSGVFGKVTAISGTTITVDRPTLGREATSTTSFTIDASSATVVKDNATSSVSSIAVGDTILAQGTVTGSNVVATSIRDSLMRAPNAAGKGPRQEGEHGSSTPAFVGNGSPIIFGSVTSISGSSIVITNKGNASYTVDATNAKIIAGGNTASSTVANIAVGDNVIVQGTINGNAITATTVVDHGVNPPQDVHQTPSDSDHSFSGRVGGLLGNVGGFFKHLFGF